MSTVWFVSSPATAREETSQISQGLDSTRSNSKPQQRTGEKA